MPRGGQRHGARRHPGLHADRQRAVGLIATAATATPAPEHGYWLVGSDGGIFTFGSAQFYGSTGSLHLQRPVVGITPTANRGGYWLVASDGGIFAFGNASYYGSIPGSGLTPAGSGLPTQPQRAHRGHGALPRRRRGTSWSPPTAASSRSVTPASRGRAPASAAATAPRWPSSPMPRATATGSSPARARSTRSATPSPTAHPDRRARHHHLGRGDPERRRATGSSTAPGRCSPSATPTSWGACPPGTAGGFDPASAIFATSDGGGYWVATAAGQGLVLRRRARRRGHVGRPPQRADRRRLRFLIAGAPRPIRTYGGGDGPTPREGTWASSNGHTTSCRPRRTRRSTPPRSPTRCSTSPTRRCSSRSPRCAAPSSTSPPRRSAWSSSRSSSSTPSTTCRTRPSRPCGKP